MRTCVWGLVWLGVNLVKMSCFIFILIITSGKHINYTLMLSDCIKCSILTRLTWTAGKSRLWHDLLYSPLIKAARWRPARRGRLSVEMGLSPRPETRNKETVQPFSESLSLAKMNLVAFIFFWQPGLNFWNPVK